MIYNQIKSGLLIVTWPLINAPKGKLARMTNKHGKHHKAVLPVNDLMDIYGELPNMYCSQINTAAINK